MLYFNLLLRTVIFCIGLAMFLGYADGMSADDSLMQIMGIVVMLFGIYRIVILFAKRKLYDEQDEQVDNNQDVNQDSIKNDKDNRNEKY